ncbi:sigma-70 family RNA polymerase sigma factor [Agromyces sp. NPDC058484]|uniref:sigma-70 family RNA polymerase sigma factor n=1 Tax=Agromyces sp. NPDC058484 TaxID=3346524 RepID=UPI00366336F0
MPPHDDARLVALYDAHAPSVWRYVVHLTGDPAGADDIVQETLLRAWRSPRILAQEPASTRSWMFTVARNLVIDEARSARRRHEIGVAETPERAQADGADALFESLLIEEALAGLDLEHRAAGRTPCTSSTVTATAARSRAGGRVPGRRRGSRRAPPWSSATSRRSRSARSAAATCCWRAAPADRR